MEKESPINFKALRAKFQEEALLAQPRSSRPAVADKPKHFPPPPPPPPPPSGGHCSAVVSGINAATEHKTAVVPRVIFRDELRASGGKRPVSFPPQQQQQQQQRSCPSPQLVNGDGATRQSLKDRHLPLVLPVLPGKEQKINVPQSKIKKKGLLLPFKSAKPSKVSTESGEEPTYADLTTRPSSAPGELQSFDKPATEDGDLLRGDQSTSECPPSSPDNPITPPSAETSVDSENKIISTLERAKKKFSRRQMLIYPKPKSSHSPDNASREKVFPSLPKNIDSVEPDLPLPPPVCFPHLACISARPFFKANNSARKPALDKHLIRGKAERPPVKAGELHPHSAPPKKSLPDLKLLGAAPVKTPRPPIVDLSRYHPPTLNEVSPSLSQAPSEEPEHPSIPIPNPVLDAPEFPDFDNSEMEMAESEAVDIASLELEAFELISSELPPPKYLRVSEIEGPQTDLCSSAEPTVSSLAQDLNLGSDLVIPLDPAGFSEQIIPSEIPEPTALDEWNRSDEAIVNVLSSSHADETDLGAAEFVSVPEESQLSSHASLNDGIQLHQSGNQQDSYYEACDNVYEDVENLNKFILSHNSRKHKASLKNPYADNLPMKEEAGHNIWPRNPCYRGSTLGEHTHSAYNHIHSKERQSPNTAEHKEQKKREKQRLEKEKKEQKEREKKENEMKKKFKVTGEEEPMYHAKVTVASKVRKNDLPVKTGDTVSIIRTTNCPKGKWLARDANHKYGYISVMNVELNIQEMLELGKKAQAAGRGGNLEADTISVGSRSSSPPEFTDDSEEWACEDETLPASNESISFLQQPETSCGHASARHTLSDANLEDLHTQTRHEALQKLAIFFQHSKDELGDVADREEATPTNVAPPNFLSAVEEPPYPEQEDDFTELEFLPPPPLYADIF